MPRRSPTRCGRATTTANTTGGAEVRTARCGYRRRSARRIPRRTSTSSPIGTAAPSCTSPGSRTAALSLTTARCRPPSSAEGSRPAAAAASRPLLAPRPPRPRRARALPALLLGDDGRARRAGAGELLDEALGLVEDIVPLRDPRRGGGAKPRGVG